MWEIKAEHLFDPTFTGFKPYEVLLNFEGPKMFTLFQGEGLFFASLAEDDWETGEMRFLVAKTNARQIYDLKSGAISIKDVFDGKPLFIVDTDVKLNVLQSTKVIGLEAIPHEFRPEPDVLLHPHLKRPAIERTISIDGARELRNRATYSNEPELEYFLFNLFKVPPFDSQRDSDKLHRLTDDYAKIYQNITNSIAYPIEKQSTGTLKIGVFEPSTAYSRRAPLALWAALKENFEAAKTSTGKTLKINKKPIYAHK